MQKRNRLLSFPHRWGVMLVLVGCAFGMGLARLDPLLSRGVVPASISVETIADSQSQPGNQLEPPETNQPQPKNTQGGAFHG